MNQDLFPLLRVLTDRPGTPARFLLLGSASPELGRRTSESLAGRIAYHRLRGSSLEEVGASWEGFAIEETISHTGARPEECYFWGTHGGAELDLLLVRGRQRIGFEVKRTTATKVTPSMRSALEDLRVDRLYVIHAGHDTFPLAERITAVPLARILRDVPPLH